MTTWIRWRVEGRSWRRILAVMDDAVDRFVDEQLDIGKHATVTVDRRRWDVPETALQFWRASADGSWGRMQLTIVGRPLSYELRFAAACWFDADEGPGGRTRYWAHNDGDLERDWMVALARPYGRLLVEDIRLRLRDVYETLSHWEWDPAVKSWYGHGLVEEDPVELRSS